MRNTAALVLLLAASCPLAFAVGGTKKVQCWTDEHGHRACGDNLPPQYAGKERNIFNERGVVVEKKERAKTPDELEADEHAREKAEREEKETRRLEAYDRFLMQTYQTVDELEIARDARVSALSTRSMLAEKAIKDSQATLTTLKARSEALQKEGKPVDPKLEKQVRDFGHAVADNTKARDQLITERDALNASFTRDIARFKELQQASASTSSR
jgi:hypothetical protein